MSIGIAPAVLNILKSVSVLCFSLISSISLPLDKSIINSPFRHLARSNSELTIFEDAASRRADWHLPMSSAPHCFHQSSASYRNPQSSTSRWRMMSSFCSKPICCSLLDFDYQKSETRTHYRRSFPTHRYREFSKSRRIWRWTGVLAFAAASCRIHFYGYGFLFYFLVAVTIFKEENKFQVIMGSVH